MNAWSTYFSERFTPRLSLVVITGIAATGVILGKSPFLPLPFLVSCFTLLYITFLLRLTNDRNDYDKDRIAFPNRALPRGLLVKKEVNPVIRILQFGLIGYFALIFILYGGTTRTALLLTAIYLWFLFNHFYVEKWLKEHPLINGLAHQGLVIPLTFLVISFGRPEYAFSTLGWAYAILLFGSFFTFDICRKLDPYSHPISLYYIHYYGFRISYLIVCGLLLISALGAFGMGVHFWLWPCEIVVCILLTTLFKTPKQFSLAEMTAGLSLWLTLGLGFFSGFDAKKLTEPSQRW